MIKRHSPTQTGSKRKRGIILSFETEIKNCLKKRKVSACEECIRSNENCTTLERYRKEKTWKEQN